jgi:hypothetical protein
VRVGGATYECTTNVVVNVAFNQPYAPAGVPIYGPCRNRFTSAEAESAQHYRVQVARKRAEADLERAAELARKEAVERERREVEQRRWAAVEARLPALARPRRPSRKENENASCLVLALAPVAFLAVGTLASGSGTTNGRAAIAGGIAAFVLLFVALVQPWSRLSHMADLAGYREAVQAADARTAERAAMYSELCVVESARSTDAS